MIACTFHLKHKGKYFDLIEGLLAEIKEHYGTPIPFSLGILNGKEGLFFGESDYEKAIQAWGIMLDQYPNFSDGNFNIALAKHELGIEYAQDLIQIKESLSTSTFYTGKRKERIPPGIEGISLVIMN